MRSLSASDLLDVWERGLGQHPVDRALTLLAACDGEGRQDLAALSIGQRDARLCEIYEHLFGPTINAFAECPKCTERLEYSLLTRDLTLAPKMREAEASLTLCAGDVTLQLRLPNSMDLGAVSRCADVNTARGMLIERCVVEASEGGLALPVPALVDATAEQVAARLADA